MVQETNFLIYLVAFIGLLVGSFKSVDWLISTKYRTKDECEKCRKVIFEAINKDRDLLVRLDAKMDVVLEKIKDNQNSP